MKVSLPSSDLPGIAPVGASVTLRDVALAAGVSVGTASKVMAGLPGVTTRRMESVHSAARQLGYRPNGLAADLRRNRSNSIGLIIPDLRNSFFVDLVHALEGFASTDGYFLVLGHANEDPKIEMERIRFVLSRRVAGMILIPCQGHNHVLEELRQCSVPVVMADRVNENMPANTVATDSVHAALIGTQHLLSLGHKRIAFAANTLDLTNTRDRVNGYSQAMQDAGLVPQVILCGTTEDQAHPALLNALLKPDRPSALFTSGAPMTLAALSAIRDANLQLPAEVSLLSFDDAPWMSVLSPRISAIRQPIETIGRAIWQLMLGELNGSSDGRISHLSFKAELRPRETTVAWAPRT